MESDPNPTPVPTPEGGLKFTDGLAGCSGVFGGLACIVVFLLLPSKEAIKHTSGGYGYLGPLLGMFIAGLGSIFCLATAFFLGLNAKGSSKRAKLTFGFLILFVVGLYSAWRCGYLPTG